jgi:hypothetical protein
MRSGRIGLGVGVALGMAVASIAIVPGTAPSIARLVANPVISFMLTCIAGFLAWLAYLDWWYGEGDTIGCFFMGLITGFEMGLLIGDFAIKGHDATLKFLEGIFMLVNFAVDEYADLPSRRECGIFP